MITIPAARIHTHPHTALKDNMSASSSHHHHSNSRSNYNLYVADSSEYGCELEQPRVSIIDRTKRFDQDRLLQITAYKSHRLHHHLRSLQEIATDNHIELWPGQHSSATHANGNGAAASQSNSTASDVDRSSTATQSLLAVQQSINQQVYGRSKKSRHSEIVQPVDCPDFHALSMNYKRYGDVYIVNMLRKLQAETHLLMHILPTADNQHSSSKSKQKQCECEQKTFRPVTTHYAFKQAGCHPVREHVVILDDITIEEIARNVSAYDSEYVENYQWGNVKLPDSSRADDYLRNAGKVNDKVQIVEITSMKQYVSRTHLALASLHFISPHD